MSGVFVAAGATVLAAGVAYSASESASKRAAKSASTELEFAQNQYDDWKGIYGPVEENLSNYYGSLTAESFAAQGIQTVEEEYARVSSQLEQSLAQRGITDSGIAAGLETQNLFETAKQRAQVRADAPAVVAQQQLDFLSVGQGNNPTGAYQNALSNQAARDQRAADQADAALAGSVSTAVQTGLSAATSSSTPATGANSSALAGSPTIDYNVGVA